MAGMDKLLRISGDLNCDQAHRGHCYSHVHIYQAMIIPGANRNDLFRNAIHHRAPKA